ncbi:MAG: hypothetical protein JXM79_24215 [Sedimentisphaerales bacterium]|nr:hypothetical protein [Sedimentisphaerales bacterium]
MKARKSNSRKSTNSKAGSALTPKTGKFSKKGTKAVGGSRGSIGTNSTGVKKK